MQRHSSRVSLTAFATHSGRTVNTTWLPQGRLHPQSRRLRASTESKGPKSAFTSRRDHIDKVQHTKPFFGYSDDTGETLTGYSEVPSRLSTSPKQLMLQLLSSSKWKQHQLPPHTLTMMHSGHSAWLVHSTPSTSHCMCCNSHQRTLRSTEGG